MPLEFGTPPRTRENNLLDYAAEVKALRSHPDRTEWGLMGVFAKTDADKVVRTLKQVGGIEVMTRASGAPGVEDGRAVWARAVEIPDD